MRVVILGSGRGSNAGAILKAQSEGKLGRAKVVQIFADKADAGILALGARSAIGAVLFTIPSGRRPEPGVYDLAESLHVVQTLVVTGSPTHPTGAFRAHTGTLTIVRSTDAFIAGHFDLQATGFEAAELDDETRELAVGGVFTATPGR